VRHPAGALAWLVNPFVAGNPADMLTTNAAMLAFDAEPGLCQVQAPALVLGGTADPYYSEDLFRRTTAAIPGGQAVIFPGKGHLYPTASKAAANIALGFLLGPVAKVNAPSRGRRAHRRERSWVGFPGRWA
jgi:pimeloyl-ACP methyl ester carboxylesterase